MSEYAVGSDTEAFRVGSLVATAGTKSLMRGDNRVACTADPLTGSGSFWLGAGWPTERVVVATGVVPVSDGGGERGSRIVRRDRDDHDYRTSRRREFRRRMLAGNLDLRAVSFVPFPLL